MIDNFHLLRPWWLLALPFILIAVFYLQRVQYRATDWRRVFDPELLEALTQANPNARRWWIDILIAGLVFAVIALAGPSLKKDTRPVYRKADARIILFDISRSMNATDIAPSRLERSRLAVAKILDESQSYRTALIAYAGDAWLMAPFTRDGRTLKTMLGVLETNVAPVQGSRPDRALMLAEKLISRGDASGAEIIVLSDGFKGSRSAEIATSMRRKGHRVSVLATGTADGATISLSNGELIRDFNKEVVVAKTDMTLASELAAAGGGTMRTLSEPLDSIGEWLENMAIVPEDEEDLDGESEDEVVTWRDDGPWLILPLLLFASLAFRRGWLMVLPLATVVGLGMSPAPVRADFIDIFMRKDQQTAAALDRGDFDRAFDKAPDAAWAGTVSYRRGDFAGAALLFTDDNSADGHYNRGNALAMAGELEKALDAYKAALNRYPEHEDATFNFQLVRKLIEQQKQEQNKEDSEIQFDDADGTGSDSGGGGEGGVTESSDEQKSEESDVLPKDAKIEVLGDFDSAGEQTPVMPEYSEDDKMSPAEVNVWLDRVPDDPSGLIRRKFAIEQSQRRQQNFSRGQSW